MSRNKARVIYQLEVNKTCHEFRIESFHIQQAKFEIEGRKLLSFYLKTPQSTMENLLALLMDLQNIRR